MVNGTSAPPMRDPLQTRIRMRLSLWALLKRHADVRRVDLTKLINDVMCLWVLDVTDDQDPRFKEEVIGTPYPESPIERYAGYIASLGFDPE